MIRKKTSFVSANVNPGNNNTFVTKPYTEYSVKKGLGLEGNSKVMQMQKRFADKKTAVNRNKAHSDAKNRSQELHNTEKKYFNKYVLKKR